MTIFGFPILTLCIRTQEGWLIIIGEVKIDLKSGEYENSETSETLESSEKSIVLSKFSDISEVSKFSFYNPVIQ